MSQYIAAVCKHCQTKQAVDAEKLCHEQSSVVLGSPSESRLVVVCEKCKKKFTVIVDCSEYQK